MTIQPMTGAHREQVLDMMRIFYRSPAVHTDGSEEIFQSDVENCISDNPFLEGYVFEEAGQIRGYGMVAKSFSTEFGKPCIWIEDLYILEDFRGTGIGGAFLKYLSEKYSHAVLRLEVEAENQRAVHVYQKAGFQVLPYQEMIKGNDDEL